MKFDFVFLAHTRAYLNSEGRNRISRAVNGCMPKNTKTAFGLATRLRMCQSRSYGLGRPVAGEKRVRRHPACVDDLGAQEGQDDMATTEDERTGAGKSIEERDRLPAR